MAKLVIGTTGSGGVPAIVKEVAPVEPYPLLSRVADDSNNEIGTVSGYFTDANNQKYAVVCLDAQYRLANTAAFSDSNTEITTLPAYGNITVWESEETATYNCDKLLEAVNNSQGVLSSAAITHCRSKSFTIGGVLYYGQLPNVKELFYIASNRTYINAADTSASQYSSFLIPAANGTGIYGSNLYSATNYLWSISPFNGGVAGLIRTNTNTLIAPILEIPIN